jgi:hypothetical protein
MTISSTTVRNSYSGDGTTDTFTYNFKIFQDSDIQVIIRSANGTETIKTITTHYTVTDAGVASGGTVIFTAGNIPTNTETVVLRRNIPQTQAIDYIANDPFPAESHEEGLDRATMAIQQLQEEVTRSLKLSKTNTMTSTEFTVGAAARANKILAFDASGELSVTQELGTNRGTDATITTEIYVQRDIVKSTSAAELNNVYICIADSVVGDLLTDTDHFDLLVDAVSAATSATNASNSASAASSSETNAANSASAASTSASNASTSETNAANSASAASTSETNAAASYDSFDDRYLGAKATDPSVDNDGDALIDGALYFDTTLNVMKVYDLGTTSWKRTTPTSTQQTAIDNVDGISADVTTVAGISANVTTVAGISANVTTVADNDANVTTVATNIASVNTVSTNIADIITVANDLNEAVSEVTTVADDLNEAISEIDTVSNSIANVDIVGNNIANVNIVATNDANITTVAGINADVTTVAGISSDVTTVAGDATDIGTVATDLTGTDTIGTVATDIANINTVAGISGDVTTVANIDSEIVAVSADATDIGTVAANIGDVSAVGSDLSNNFSYIEDNGSIADAVTSTAGTSLIETVADDIANVNIVAGDIANVNTVAGDIVNVNSVATNISGVNSFADRYRVVSADPITSLDEGDLAYNTTANVLKYYDGSAWNPVVAGALTDVVQDGSPQLGGDLDGQNFNLSNIGTIDGTNLQIDFGGL